MFETNLLGQDGGTSIAADGKTFWAFNDTRVLLNGQPQLIPVPNNVASSVDDDASDCVALEPKAQDGLIQPVLERSSSEWGVFPSGLLALEPGYIHLYYASAAAGKSSDYEIQGFGLARFDTKTMTGARLLGGALIWDQNNPGGFLIHDVLSLTHEGYAYALLRATLTNGAMGTILARTPVESIEGGAYEYWDGTAWTAEMPDPLANPKAFILTDPVAMNAPSISFNSYLGKWVAVYTGGFAHIIKARVADNLTGPWTDETILIDCLDFLPVPQTGFICYMGQQHESYARDGDKTLYLTYSNEDAYRVYLHEIKLAAPVTQWTDAKGRATYLPPGTKGPAGSTAGGVAFYASDAPVAGFAGIHRWQDNGTGELAYDDVQPGPSYADLGVDFYAPATQAAAQGTNASYAPVYRWTSGAGVRYSALDLEAAGYAQGSVAFYAACPDRDGDSRSDCEESFLGTDEELADSDGDALTDDYELTTEGCDPLMFTDDLDGLPTVDEAFFGTTNPCIWDSGGWGCANAPWRPSSCNTDTDDDVCNDAWELGPDPLLGGQRDPDDTWDYFNPTRDGENRADDIRSVVDHYFEDQGSPDYETRYDRTPVLGEPLWRPGAPNGRIRADDIALIVKSFWHDCT